MALNKEAFPGPSRVLPFESSNLLGSGLLNTFGRQYQMDSARYRRGEKWVFPGWNPGPTSFFEDCMRTRRPGPEAGFPFSTRLSRRAASVLQGHRGLLVAIALIEIDAGPS